ARFAALGALPLALTQGPGETLDVRAFVLIAAPLIGRWAMVYAVTRYPYARASGVGAPFRGSDGTVVNGARRLALATLLTATLGLLVTLLALLASILRLEPHGVTLAVTPDVGGVVLAGILLLAGLWLIGTLITLGWSYWAARRLGGGLTGDTYGALNELVELGVLVCATPLAIRLVHGVG
ncbi:MAG TPA: adenosylcobinamide-GDP ribazoletransferase, partial [Ktedonobacterales bacterium]|nr:adenosylcobinamide-GDP ribazoletransferase [Ktedonobacterales bacterium]